MRIVHAPALLLAVTMAVPAAAQFVGRPDSGFQRTPDPFLGSGQLPGQGVGRELRDNRRQIGRARESGAISRREARALRREAARIEAAAERYAADGLSASERREIAVRGRVLREQAGRAATRGH